MAEVKVEWVEGIPPRKGGTHSSYDYIGEEVRGSGKTARIKARDKNHLSSLANHLRERFKDLQVATRTLEEGLYVYIGLKGEVPSEAPAKTTPAKKGATK
jgi:hypothetical protein